MNTPAQQDKQAPAAATNSNAGRTRSLIAIAAACVVGGAAYPTDYTRRVEALADSRTRLLGGVWDDALLDQLSERSRSSTPRTASVS